MKHTRFRPGPAVAPAFAWANLSLPAPRSRTLDVATGEAAILP